MKLETKNFIRWLAILPLSFITSILIHFPIHFILYSFLMFGNFINCDVYPKLPEIIITSFVSPFVFIYTAYIIAPKHKLLVIRVIFTLFLILSIGVLIFSQNFYGTLEVTFNYNGIQTIMYYLGLITGFIFCNRDFKMKK